MVTLVPDDPPRNTLVTLVFPMDEVESINLYLPFVPQRGQMIEVRDVGLFSVRDLTWVVDPGVRGSLVGECQAGVGLILGLERVLT